MGDAEWLWNGTPAVGLRAGHNLAFLQALVAWLVEPPGRALEDTAAARSPPTTAPAVVAWAGPDGYPFGDAPDEYGALVRTLRNAGFPTVVTADTEAVVHALVVLLADPTRPVPSAAHHRPVVALLHAISQ